MAAEPSDEKADDPSAENDHREIEQEEEPNTHEIQLSPAHEMMARQLGADEDFMAVAVQNALEEEYGNADARRRQQQAAQEQTPQE